MREELAQRTDGREEKQCSYLLWQTFFSLSTLALGRGALPPTRVSHHPLSLSRFFPTFNDVLAACTRLTQSRTTQSRSFWQEPVSSTPGLQTKPHMGERPAGDSSFDSGNMLQPPHNYVHTHARTERVRACALCWSINSDG